MNKRKENPIRRFLRLLTDDELNQLYALFGKKELLKGYSRSLLIDTIERDMSYEEFVKNEYIFNLALSKLSLTASLTESIAKRLEKVDLIGICRDLGMEGIVSNEMEKARVLREILDSIPTLELWKSKRFQERLKPTYISATHIKSLQKELNILNDNVGSISNEIKFASNKISLMDKDIKSLSMRLQSVDGMFNTGTAPDLQAYLKAMYEEAAATGEHLVPEAFQGIGDRIQKRLGIDERVFVLKGLELLLTHYFLTQVKLLPWKPSLEDFLEIFKAEFEKAKVTEDQAEIPTLRKKVCQRMGINDELFDELLIDAWKKDLVKLDVGRPIGEYDVKYLATENGRKFFYVKLRG